MKRVYVMDCGDFVKIGVSGNTEMRKMQIPYQVNQYYCTKKISNAFEIERKMHATFSKKRVSNAFGREYFSVPFADNSKVDQTWIVDDNGLDGKLSSGRESEGSVYFEVPEDAESVELEYDINLWQSDKIIFVGK